LSAKFTKDGYLLMVGNKHVQSWVKFLTV